MALYQLRTYTLATPEAARAYEIAWERHLGSLPRFKIHTHGVFRSLADPRQVVALVSFFDGVDPQAANEAYMASAEFKADMEGLGPIQMVSVEAVPLEPLSSSPLR